MYPKVLVRSEASSGRVGALTGVMPAAITGPRAYYLIVCTPAHFEREFARRAARNEGGDTPDSAMQEIPPVTLLGLPIGEERA